MVQNHRRIGPHSRLLARGSIGGRSREGRFLAACRAELTEHLGGSPSATERMLIDRVAWLRLHVALLDEKITRGGQFTDHDRRQYLAFSNSLVRATRELGLRPAAARPLSLSEYLARRAATEEPR